METTDIKPKRKRKDIARRATNMCMELYHGDEDEIEFYNMETKRLKDEYWAEVAIEQWCLDNYKINNDPAWVS